MQFRVAALCVLLLAPALGAQPRWTTYRPGIRLGTIATRTQQAWIVAVDLHSPHVGIRATRAADHGITTSTFARRYGVQVAVNGGFFNFSGYVPSGLALADGTPWHADAAGEGYAAFGADRRVDFQHNVHTAVANADLPGWYRQAVGGHPVLVWDGASTVTPCPAGDGLCSTPNPRTGSGISRDGNTLYVFTIDGRRKGASGMTLPEFAATMRSVGVWRGMNHDGGGSTTLYLQGRGVVNHPSDGSERVVANHLGIVWRDPRCTGGARGTVRDHATHRPIAGALVVFSDGTRVRSDATGRFDARALDCDLLDVTATATGYREAMRTVPVDPLSYVDASVELTAIPVAMDAGVTMPDAGIMRTDAATTDARTLDATTADVPIAEDADEDDATADDDAGATVEADGSTSEWDGGDMPVEAVGDGSGCACGVAGGSNSGAEFAWGVVLAAVVGARRRRSNPYGPQQST